LSICGQIYLATLRRTSVLIYVSLLSAGVVQGRLRSGSVPPRSLRAGSQPPGARAGSVAPSARSGSVAPHHTIVSAGPGGIIKHRAMTTSVVRGVRGDGSTGVVDRPPRSSHALASNANLQRRRASISVVPSAAAAARRTADSHQPIVRIDICTTR